MFMSQTLVGFVLTLAMPVINYETMVKLFYLSRT